MMTVLHVTSYGELYGANRSLLDLVDGLRDHGVRSIVLVPCEGGLTATCQRHGIEYLVWPFETWVNSPPRYDVLDLNGISSYRRLLRLAGWSLLNFRQRMSRGRGLSAKRLRNERQSRFLARSFSRSTIDLVHTHSAVNPFGSLLARDLSLPHVWHLREFVDLHYRYQFDLGKGRALARIKQSSAVICISNAISNYYFGDKRNVSVVYNGVLRLARFQELLAHAGKGSKPQPGVFAIVGLLHAAKQQSEAIKALSLVSKKHPSVRLLIAGDGSDESLLRSLAAELGVDKKVDFLGYVSNPFEVYKQASAVLMCSRYEAMGRVTAEAMAAWRPVIGFDQAGTAELIQHGFSGLLYRDGPEELAKCMADLIENPGLVLNISENAWNIAVTRHTIEKYSNSVYQVYRKVIEP
ncbi:hypothetical protein CKO25_10590 [Thiocapsa imhoffii]|uniref:Glycosyltransferase family 1 protein n=1 Tax=Thiocapsa imhoffii TaxID=382777 RepID=A0A9X1B8R9_9GAMM|nr:glycosyltransferase [Thiocapsa imhoffii]MBK1645092.1 hypothetical protein [Thiocapsa imhoffii]